MKTQSDKNTAARLSPPSDSCPAKPRKDCERQRVRERHMSASPRIPLDSCPHLFESSQTSVPGAQLSRRAKGPRQSVPLRLKREALALMAAERRDDARSL